MARCYAGESCCHRFQQAVWDALSIAIRCLLTWMEKKVTFAVKVQERRLADESRKIDSPV